MKPYWAKESGSDWKMLVFAYNPNEAKSLFMKHSPTFDTVEWIYIRVWQAEEKWMALYDGSDYCDSYPGDYETWEEFWKWEMGE